MAVPGFISDSLARVYEQQNNYIDADLQRKSNENIRRFGRDPYGEFSTEKKENMDVESLRIQLTLPPSPRTYDRIRMKRTFFSYSSPVSKDYRFIVRKAKPYSEKPKILILNGEVLKENKLAKSCYENMVKIDDFSRSVFHRRVVANDTKAMVVELKNYFANNHVLWLRDQEIVITGDVDPRIFTRHLAGDIDVLTHEFGLAFIQYVSDLKYSGESGALHRSLADIFTIMRKQYSNRELANDINTSWLISEGLIVDDKAKGALRSLDNPGSAHKSELYGKDYQIKHVSDIDTSWNDYETMHALSGIPNHVFYLAATKEGGCSWENIGKIWFRALEKTALEVVEKPIHVSFSAFADKTIKIANKYGSSIENIVGQAWMQVGVMPGLKIPEVEEE